MPAPRTKNARAQKPAIYWELAPWFHLLTHPKSYAGEARFVRQTLLPLRPAVKPTMLELGSGGGNNALHLKKHFDLTLTDVSPGMLALSRKINPECTHIEGDMRRLRLKRQFDFVFVHDAIMYMLSERDLARAMKTAFVHCKPGGVALFQPDFVRETYKPMRDRGGHRDGMRALRYVEVSHPLTRGATSADVEIPLDHDRRRRCAHTHRSSCLRRVLACDMETTAECDRIFRAARRRSVATRLLHRAAPRLT